MKKIQYILTGICSLLLMSSCLGEYQELNTNPEQLGNVDPRNAFTGATLNFNNCSRGHLTGLYSGSMIYMQYLVGNNGASQGNYITLSQQNSRPAPSNYAYSEYYNVITDGAGAFGLRLDNLLNTLIPLQEHPEQYNDVAAISRILMAYEQWRILDAFGAAPLTEAFKVDEGIRTPRYDLYQQSIDGTPMYEVLDRQVADAVSQLGASDASQANLGDNDFFYKGDVAKWIKFGNTLRVKMAQRLEKADKAFYDKVIGEVLTSADKVIGSQEESFVYWHHRDYNSNVDDIQDITKSYSAAAAFVNFLKAYDDPRLPLLVRRNGFGDKNNNTQNDTTFTNRFFKQYPDYQVYYEALDSVADLRVFAENRYIGQSANPATRNANPNFYGNAWVDFFMPILDENGQPQKDEDGKTLTATEQLRGFSQFESRYFVKNGGARGNVNMNVRCMEDAQFIQNSESLQAFTPMLTYPETCFMLAEIAVKKGSGVAGKDATAWYREGIRAAMVQLRTWAENCKVVAQTGPVDETTFTDPLTDAEIDAYMARPEFQTATLEKIISQQWVNLFMQANEMWATWKRTGLPSFNADGTPEGGVAHFEEVKNDGTDLVIPRRNALPTPNSLNMENYNAALEALKSDPKYGTDYDRTEGRIWWDVE